MPGVADKNALKAGIFILVSLALALTVFFAVQGVGWNKGNAWIIRFDVADDVSGVGPGAEVRIGGVKKGQVKLVRLSDDMRNVDVRIELPRDVILRDKPRVTIQATVTGVAWLNFDSLGDGEPMTAGSTIPGEAGTFSNLVAAANKLAPAVTGLVDDVRNTTVPQVNEVLSKSSRTMDSVESAATRASSAAGTVDDLLKANSTALEETLANLRDASDKAPELIEESRGLVEKLTDAAEDIRKTLDGTGQRLNRLIDTSQTIAEDMQQVGSDTKATVREVRGLITGNRGKIEQIINRVRDASATLSLASAEIRRSPWRLLYKPDGQQRESLDLYDAARRFAEGASALQDAAIALQDAAGDSTSDPAKVQALIDELQRKFAEFDQIERQLYERLEE